jgi:hypothetical protein
MRRLLAVVATLTAVLAYRKRRLDAADREFPAASRTP